MINQPTTLPTPCLCLPYFRRRHWIFELAIGGPACALGHPIGATGPMLIGTLLDELERQEAKRVSIGHSGRSLPWQSFAKSRVRTH